MVRAKYGYLSRTRNNFGQFNFTTSRHKFSTFDLTEWKKILVNFLNLDLTMASEKQTNFMCAFWICNTSKHNFTSLLYRLKHWFGTSKCQFFFLLKTMLISMYASVRMEKRQSNTIRANLMKIKMVTECAAIWIEFASYKYTQHWHQLIYCSEYMLTNVKVFWILSNGFACAHDLPVRLDNYICCKWFSL